MSCRKNDFPKQTTKTETAQMPRFYFLWVWRWLCHHLDFNFDVGFDFLFWILCWIFLFELDFDLQTSKTNENTKSTLKPAKTEWTQRDPDERRRTAQLNNGQSAIWKTWKLKRCWCLFDVPFPFSSCSFFVFLLDACWYYSVVGLVFDSFFLNLILIYWLIY